MAHLAVRRQADYVLVIMLPTSAHLQFVTLAGFHANNYGMFELARNYKKTGMEAYSNLQEKEFSAERHGYTAVKHQREVGASYFDKVATTAAGGEVSTREHCAFRPLSNSSSFSRSSRGLY